MFFNMRTKKLCKDLLLILLVAISTSLFMSCSKEHKKGATNELVMRPGMSIKATNTDGTITIEATKPYKRTYKWDSQEVSVNLSKRDKRWNGSFGIYSPGGSGNIHTVVEEGQQHFFSEKEALEWLSWQENAMHYVYSSDGLVVGWHVTKKANSPLLALSVQVWQFFVQGQKPSKLPGASDDLVAESYSGGESSEDIMAGQFTPSSPATVLNRLYSGKSLDIMNEKNIKAESVENCIKTCKSENQGAYTFYYDLKNNQPLWIMLDTDGRVVLVGN